MKFTVLSINKMPFYIPQSDVGFISIYQNYEGTQIECFCKKERKHRKMKLNEVVEIELMAINAELNPSVFKWAHSTFISPQLDERECEGFEIFVRGKTFYIPFQEVGGAACFLITVTKDKVEISISGMTKDILMLDYYRAEMEIGQHISVAYTHLKKITEPSRKRRYLEEP